MNDMNIDICKSLPDSLKQIYNPVLKELKLTEVELYSIVKAFVKENPEESASIKHFFNVPGKYLRPVLVLLSSKAGSLKNKGKKSGKEIINLAVAVELMHSASLIHDDILDNSDERRDGKSLNNKYGNKVAVIAGDILYAKAFSLLIRTHVDEIMDIMCRTTETMCVGEINDIGHGKSDYLKVIENKTASLMSASCQCGALLSGADKKSVKALSSYGYNFGMAYQLVDDYIDNDSALNRTKIHFYRLLDKHTAALEKDLTAIEDSSYRRSLQNLLYYVLGQIPKTKPKGR